MRVIGLYLAMALTIAGILAVVLQSAFAPSEGVRIAVLTPELGAEVRESSVLDLRDAAARAVLGFQDVDLLSRAATRSIADQPYLRLFFEHGVQWSIESRVVDSDAGYKIVLSLIDARTGLVADIRPCP